MSAETWGVRAARDQAVRVHGWRKLRDGCIHMRCPKCGRKQSNMKRAPEDHPTAFLIEMLCDNCDAGTKDAGASFYDKRGRELTNDPDRWRKP